MRESLLDLNTYYDSGDTNATIVHETHMALSAHGQLLRLHTFLIRSAPSIIQDSQDFLHIFDCFQALTLAIIPASPPQIIRRVKSVDTLVIRRVNEAGFGALSLLGFVNVRTCAGSLIQ